MKPYGFNLSQKRHKWRCPMMNRTINTCKNPCSTAQYWRTFHTCSTDNSWLFPQSPRDSKQWKIIYKRRTSSEGTNKRQKIDYKLESDRHRYTKMWYLRIYAIIMCQHIDVRYTHQKEGSMKMKRVIFLRFPSYWIRGYSLFLRPLFKRGTPLRPFWHAHFLE